MSMEKDFKLGNGRDKDKAAVDAQRMYIKIACNRLEKIRHEIESNKTVKLDPNGSNIFEPAEGGKAVKVV